MYTLRPLITTALLACITTTAALFPSADSILQQPLSSENLDNSVPPSASSISPALFSSLERLARLVDIAYCVGTSGLSPPFSCASRCKDFPDFELASTWNTGVLMSDSCGYVAIDHGSKEKGKTVSEPAIVVAFRGTYSITNTVVDLSTVPQEYVPYPDPGDGGGERNGKDEGTMERCTNCTVHMGFMESWKQARKLVLPVLKNVRSRHPNYPIHLVGHSLGGAVACLAALELKIAMGWDDLVITTFGEPQTGNAGFVDFVDRVFELSDKQQVDSDPEQNMYRRVTHMDDPVPLLPLSEWGYRPHAGEIFITKKDLSPGTEDLRLCHGDEDPSCILGGANTSRLKLWQLLFAHRDYFWRLGLCLPGGDPADWGRPPYNVSSLRPDEL